jgi:hypothetical protein
MREASEVDRLLLLSEPEIVAWLELSAAELRLLAGTTEREEDDEAAGEP